MSQNFTVKNVFIGGGIRLENTREFTADNIINATEDVSAGIAGTAGASGVMTVAGGHGYTDGQKVCVFGAFGVNYGGTVSESGSTSFKVSGGAGDTLPTSGAVVISHQIELDIVFSGSNAKALFIGGDVALACTLEDVGGVELYKTFSANGAYQWDSGNEPTCPVDGDSIILAHVYNKGLTAGTVTIMVGYDN